jgi:hypothetical protein
MAALYTEPCFSDYTRSLYHPAASSSSAILSKQMHGWRAQRARAERFQVLKAKAGAWDDGTLAVEDLESAARQTLEAASALIASHPNEPWLLATRQASTAAQFILTTPDAVVQLPPTPRCSLSFKSSRASREVARARASICSGLCSRATVPRCGSGTRQQSCDSRLAMASTWPVLTRRLVSAGSEPSLLTQLLLETRQKAKLPTLCALSRGIVSSDLADLATGPMSASHAPMVYARTCKLPCLSWRRRQSGNLWQRYALEKIVCI